MKRRAPPETHGRLDAVLRRYRSTAVYYLTIESQVERSGGYALWDRDSRRYAVENGEVKMTKQELITMIENAGFEAVERDTVYNRVEKVGA